jgi:predicted dehydrogenase
MSRIHRRHFLQQSAAAGAALAISRKLRAAGVHEKLNLAIIGQGWRGGELLKQFSKLSNVRISALCDVDQALLDKAAQDLPGVTIYTDLRKLLDNKNIDAVAIATCNHWHVLAALWACQAGKDVYVEKPLCHNHWEGQQLVKAARKFDRIVQVGTQQRSDPLQAELKEFLHKDKKLGDIQYVEVCRYGKREPIGKRSEPLKIPSSVDYNLWVGPAEDKPIFRDKLHYDWHWDWNTGNGEQGNWGVHVLDDAVNVVLLDEVPFPKRILAGGGRLVWDDAGQTPNVTFVSYDTGSTPIIFGLSNLPTKPGSKDSMKYKGVGSGYVIQCEDGYYAGGRGGGAAHDRKGKEIRKFKGDSGDGHQRNFVEAVLDHDRNKLNCEVQVGHQATAWCNLANVACRMGKPYSERSAAALGQDLFAWEELVEKFKKHLANNGVDIASSEFRVSPVLEFDAAGERFTGPSAAEANQLLRRKYTRNEFAVPPIS